MEDVGIEVRKARGESGPGPSDTVFLASLTSDRRIRADRARGTLGGLTLAVAIALALLLPETRSGSVPAVPSPGQVSAETNPMAALMLESARIRLEGVGDPRVGVARLHEIVESFPDSPSAREALILLAQLEETKP
jgi:hypothetical protein